MNWTPLMSYWDSKKSYMQSCQFSFSQIYFQQLQNTLHLMHFQTIIYSTILWYILSRSIFPLQQSDQRSTVNHCLFLSAELCFLMGPYRLLCEPFWRNLHVIAHLFKLIICFRLLCFCLQLKVLMLFIRPNSYQHVF